MSPRAESVAQRPWRVAAGLCAAGATAWALRDDPKVALACAAAALMAAWWVLEALPLWATSLVPLAAIPILRDDLAPMARAQATIAPYFDPYVGLFLGGMCIGAAMQEHGLHRRFALRILLLCGSSPRRVLAGLLVAPALVSMWISNTATTAMMLPVAMAVALSSDPGEARRADRRGTAYLLAIAYGSSIGGVATKIGTPPNAQFAGFMEQRGVEIGFLQFMIVGGGFVLLFLPVAWLFLSRLVPNEEQGAGARESLRAQLEALGPMSRAERAIALVFVATALLWTVSQPIASRLEESGAPAWLRTAHVEGAIALLAALALKLSGGSRPLLPWRAVRGVPWHTLVLLGGSFGLAALVVDSKAGAQLAQLLGGLRDAPPFLALLLATLATVGLSAIASNTATCGVMLAVLWQAFGAEQALPILYGATIAASCDFALPAGTAPNAIVASSGLVSLRTMFLLGACLDLAAALVATAWVWLSVPLVHG
ncbi:MAG: hypothetical protein RL112_483 [Planctomycetota bacterium]